MDAARSWWVLVGCVMALAPGARSARAQRATTLLVTVSESPTRAPIRDAQVWLGAIGRLTRTDDRGSARIASVPEGKWTLLARRMGYGPESTTVLVAGEDTLRLELILARRASRLATVRVNAEAPVTMTGEFEARRRTALGGRFVTRADLDRMHDATLDGVFQRTIPGARVAAAAGGMTRVYSLRGRSLNGKPCEAVVFLDGILLGDGDVSRVNLDDLGGIEFYSASTIPVQYKQPGAIREHGAPGASPECGVLLLWTRR